MNLNDHEYLNRLLKQLNPDVLRAAEATMLKADIANLEIERDAAVTSTVQSYNGEIAPLRARLAELEQIHAGEQVTLFPNAPKSFAINEVGDVVEIPVQPTPPAALLRPRKNQPTNTVDGQTYYRFKSAGYLATMQRLGIPLLANYRADNGAMDHYLLTPEEYNRVARAEKAREPSGRARAKMVALDLSDPTARSEFIGNL